MEDDFKEMLELYPTLVLVSESPPTWKGSLTVTNNYTNCKTNVVVKFVVPLYPHLNDASIYFGRSIAFLFGNRFKNQIESLIKASESVPSFFQELTTAIEKMICDYHEKEMIISLKTDAREKLLKELSYVLSENSEVELSSNKDLSTIKLSMNDISIIVEPSINSSGQNSWKIVSSELPDVPGYTINEKKSFTLKEIRNMFQKQVDLLEDVWAQLRKLDNFCWVLDPLEPKPYHLYRRIYLSPSLSVFITLDPNDPTGYPKLVFIGAKNEVEKYRDLVQDEDNIEKWDLESSVYENLLSLLNIDDFPVQPLTAKSEKDEEGVFGDEECCICFSDEADDGTLPDEVCNNNKCRRRFHPTCLFRWLQELSTNKIVFNKIYGACPNCKQEVCCNVPST
ncbi:E3 ubiquitin-protein ligase FANCL [Copidosoma floridanum]|uniref:E3 ubiquitin-protein ligase FANCL n=1 Tax=Copidosoma floridanum TaxID=29053 RepID=UPI0006C95700|nr:E3 ubiquitin-protein ligase FANCL [Copidosoma floridanum]